MHAVFSQPHPKKEFIIPQSVPIIPTNGAVADTVARPSSPRAICRYVTAAARSAACCAQSTRQSMQQWTPAIRFCSPYPSKGALDSHLFACVLFAQTLDLPADRPAGRHFAHSRAGFSSHCPDERPHHPPVPAGGRKLFGLMPVLLDQKPGAYKIELLDQAGASVATASVEVVDAHFRKQNVTIAPSIAELKPYAGRNGDGGSLSEDGVRHALLV